MPRPIHDRLQQQIDHYLAQHNAPAPALDEFLQAVSDTYLEFDPAQKSSPPRKPTVKQARTQAPSPSLVLDPGGDIETLKLGDIIDVKALQSIMEDFYRFTQFPNAISDLNGTILVSAGWQDICTRFHRCHPDTLKNCHESDVILAQGLADGEVKAYRCQNGLWDVVTPIHVGGRHLGNLYIGQFFYEDEEIDREEFRERARSYGFDETEYLDALDRVPRWTREQVDAAMTSYGNLARMVSELSYSQIKLSRAVFQKEQVLAQLKASEAQASSVLQASPDGIAILDIEGRIGMASPGVYSLFGIPPEKELTGMAGLDFLVPEDRERGMTNLALLAQNQQHGPIEYRAQRVDGTLLDVEINAQTLFVGQPPVQQALVIVRDITERKQAESALQKSEQRHRDYLTHSPYGMFVANEKGRYVQVNPAACLITGYSEEELLQLSIPDMFCLEDQHLAPQHFQQLQADGHIESDVPFRPKSGNRRWWHLSAVKISDTRFLGFCNDITEKKKTEAALNENNRNLQLLFENLNSGIVVHALDSQIQMANETACRLLGLSPDTIRGKLAADPTWSFVRADETPMPLEEYPVNQVLADGQAVVRNQTLGIQQGSSEVTAWVLVNAYPETDDSGTLQRVVVTFVDITERKQAEKALQVSEQQHRDYLAYSPYTVFVADENGRFILSNQSASKVTGYSEEELLQMSVPDFYLPEDQDLGRQQFQQLTQEGQLDCETRYQLKDGSARWWHISAVKVSDSHFLGFCEDITGRRQADEALLESRQITDGILDALPIRVFWKDKELRYLGCNQAFAKDAGFHFPDDVIGKDDTQMSWKRQAGLHKKEDREVIRSGQAKLLYEEIILSPDGKTMNLLASKIPLKDADGLTTGLLGTYLDITKRKEEEQRFKDSNVRHRAISDNIPGVVYQFHFGRTGFPELTYMSSTCEELFGRPLVDLNYSALWFDHMPPEDLAEFRKSITQAARKLERWSLSFRILTPDGGIKWLRASANPQKDPKGHILWNGVVLDITDRKQAEEEVRVRMDELLRWQRATLGREGRISSLKREVNALAARLNQPRPYESATGSE